ncbi:MAG: nucleoside deaminase [Clostridium sp.]
MDYLDLAREEAKKALENDEIPVGAIIVQDGEIIGKGYNLKEKLKNPLAHAEIIAINEAVQKKKDWRLKGAEMYVTLEPCSMCISAIIQSRISKLHIGWFNRDMGACGTVLDLSQNRHLNSYVEVIWHYDKRCGDLIKNFFEGRRNMNKRL